MQSPPIVLWMPLNRPREALLSKPTKMRDVLKSAPHDLPRTHAKTKVDPSSAAAATLGQRDDLRSSANAIPSNAPGGRSADGNIDASRGAASGSGADERRGFHSLTRMRGNEDRGGGR